MPVPIKACDGRFSEETLSILSANLDRAQWHPHRCEQCGQEVGARLTGGRWTPDPHWPSVSRRRTGRTPAHSGSPTGEPQPS